MKIYLGPYRSRIVCKIHDRYMGKKYGYHKWTESSTKFEVLLEKLEDGIQWIYNNTINLYFDNIKDQRQTIRIDNYDVWSMDTTLAKIIHPMLIKLQSQKHGSPWVDDEDVPDELKSTSAPKVENVGDIDDNHHKRWDWVMGEMLFAFEMSQRDWTMDYYDFTHFDKDDPEYAKHFLGMKMELNREDDRKSVQARIDNGRRLFSKYYESLWD